MDETSAQENRKTGQSSSPAQTRSIQELEFGSTSLASEATEHVISTENVNKGSTEAGAAECDYNCIEQLRPLHENLTTNPSISQLGQQLEDATVNSNMDATSAQENSETGQSSSPIQTRSVQEIEFGSASLASVATEHAISTENVNKGSTEASTAECDYNCIEQLRPLHEDLTTNPSSSQLGQQLEDATVNYNMDATSAQENGETGHSSRPIHTRSVQELEFGSTNLASEATEHAISTENVNKGLTEASAAECDYNCLEQLRPLHEDLTKNPSSSQLGQQLEDAIVNPNMDATSAQEKGETGQSPRPIQTRSVQELEFGSTSLASEATEHAISTENVNKGSTEASTAECDYNCIEQLRPPHEDLTTNPNSSQLGQQLEDATVNPNMDATSAQEKGETGQSPRPLQVRSVQELEFGSTSLASEATEHAISTENVNKGSTEASAAECDYNCIAQLQPLHEDLTTNPSSSQLGQQLEDATVDSNMDATSAQENGETGQSSSPMKTRSIQELEFGSTSLASEATEHAIGTENVNKGSTEDSAAECDSNCIEQLRPLHKDLTTNPSTSQLGQQLEDATVNSNTQQFGLQPEDAAGKNLIAKQAMPELNQYLVPESVNSEALVEKLMDGAEKVQNGPAETGTIEFDHLGLEQSGLPSEDGTENSSWQQLRPPPEDERKSSLEQLGLPPEDVAVNTSLEEWKPLPDNVSKNFDVKQFEPPPKDATNNFSKSGGRGRRTSTKGKHALRSSVGSTRVLRSRSQEKSKAPEPSNNLAEHGDGANSEKRRKKSKKKLMKKIPVDEFSRIRKNLRYVLQRMNYEQNLIDAYSGEGWKGQSLEKIKPEKELQRAKSEIFRCKLKIRDLFQRLDLSIAEGRFPESLFDSDGLIDSEDIFCAKCGSEDLPADNDIILCDGACERGFHQFCLEPPLLKEDIPPNDEGWLCPGCDCKVDCIDFLNDSQGINLSVLDTWEKVFPEAAAAAAGNKLNDSFGFPSDDSEDDDYDPDGSEVEEKVEGDESSSDESDFYSASEDSGASPKNKQNLELPSDDSEDDDYNPNALDLDEQVKQESSSSDFTSDSEDFSVAFNNRSPCKDEPVPDKPMSASSDYTKPCKHSDGERSKVGRRKNQSLNDELLSLLASGPGQGDSACVSGKRHADRLDYKKLYDETYGNVSSDSSSEDWMDAADAPKKRRKNNTEKVASSSPGGGTPIIEGTNAKDMKHNQEENEHTPKRRAHKKLDVDGTNSSPAKSDKRSSGPGSSYRSTKRSEYKRLGEAVTQGLLKSFKENQYPERAAKENLAKELGITAHQVSKWFENARWSSRHSSRMESSLVGSVPSKGTPPQKLSEPTPKMVVEDVRNGVKNKELSVVNTGATLGNSATEESSRQRSTTARGRKRRSQTDHQASDHILSTEETQKLSVPVDLPKAQVRKRGRPRSRKSAA